jgi:sporulation protein YlmC with PRC-barrel domain
MKEKVMFARSLLAGATAAVALLAIEAQAQSTQTTIIYDLPQGRYQLTPAQSVDRAIAYRPGSPSVDLNRGMWGTQPISPPSGLVMAEQGELVGAKVYDGSGTSFGTIRRVLVDPQTGLVHYAVVSTPEVGGAYIPVPISAIELSSMKIGMAADDIRLIQAYGMGELERRYPLASLSVPLVVGPVALAPVTTVVTTTTIPAVGSAPALTVPPYRITQGGDWVGRAVTDPSGEVIGVVDYLLTDPVNGAVRHAAVSGGPIGRGNYVLIPAANLRMATGRLVSDQSTAALLSGPRLQQVELLQRYGPAVAAQ